MNAQRVGQISDFEAPKGKGPAKFKVGGLVCKAWQTIGYKDAARPNPVLEAIKGMSMADAGKLWLVRGEEQRNEWTAADGTPMVSRQFMAEAIEEADPAAQNIFTMDKDGNPIGGAGTAASIPAAGAAPSVDFFALAVEPVIAAMAQTKRATFADEDAAHIAANYRFLTEVRSDLGNSSPPSSTNGASSESEPSVSGDGW